MPDGVDTLQQVHKAVCLRLGFHGAGIMIELGRCVDRPSAFNDA